MSEDFQDSSTGEADKSTVSGEDAVAAVFPPSVGQSLRSARELANLSIAEVANALKFSPRQIELLEADNYAALPGNTIVRGFVRGYAKLVKLDAEVLLQQLEVRTPHVPIDVRPPDNMGVASQPGTLRQISPIASLAIVLFLAASFLGLWHFFGPSLGTSSGTAGKSAPPPPVAAVSSDVTPPAAPAAVPNMPTDEPGGDSAKPSAVPAPAGVAGNAGPALQFVFHGRSWVEVTDATKQKLHSGENPGGTQLTLAGRPPFDLVIGNAAKVSLTYGERAIDLSPHTRAEVARLTVE